AWPGISAGRRAPAVTLPCTASALRRAWQYKLPGRSLPMAELAREELRRLPTMERLDRSAEAIARDFRRYLDYHLGRFPGARPAYPLRALAYALRDRLMGDWRQTWNATKQGETRRAYYLSLEYLIGRSLGSHLL